MRLERSKLDGTRSGLPERPLPLRVLYLVQYCNALDQPGSGRAYYLLRYLAERGHQVTLITGAVHYQARKGDSRARRLFTRERQGSLSVVKVGWLLPYGGRMCFRWLNYLIFSATATLGGLLYGGRPQVVVASSAPLTIAVPGIILSALKRAPFVFEVRDIWPGWLVEFGLLRRGPAVRLAERLESLSYRLARRVITLTRGMREELIERGIPAEKIVHISQGADLSLCSPRSPDNAFSRAHGLGNKFVCLYTGNHGLVAGLEYVLEAARLLQDQEDIVFILMGEGTGKPALQQLARDMGLPNVRFLDPVPKLAIPEVIAAASVCLDCVRNVSVTHRFMPSKFFDYAACGRPILSNLGGESAELLDRYGAGLPTNPADASSLAEAVKELRADPERRMRMGENARRLAEEVLDRRLVADAFERLLLDIADGGRKRSASKTA